MAEGLVSNFGNRRYQASAAGLRILVALGLPSGPAPLSSFRRIHFTHEIHGAHA